MNIEQRLHLVATMPEKHLPALVRTAEGALVLTGYGGEPVVVPAERDFASLKRLHCGSADIPLRIGLGHEVFLYAVDNEGMVIKVVRQT